jgi:hypothetical protein
MDVLNQAGQHLTSTAPGTEAMTSQAACPTGNVDIESGKILDMRPRGVAASGDGEMLIGDCDEQFRVLPLPSSPRSLAAGGLHRTWGVNSRLVLECRLTSKLSTGWNLTALLFA